MSLRDPNTPLEPIDFAITAVILALLVALVFLRCAEPDLVADATCDRPCYSGPEGTAGVGACRVGTPVCEDGVLVRCEGEVTPQDETCNKIDDDCDGVLPSVDRDQDGDGVPICAGDCVDLDAERYPGAPEICNGRDEDCDEAIDEDIAPTEICYSGDLADLAHPTSACRAGVQVCVAGALRCVGEALPSPEICDRADNDCNGRIDDVPAAAGQRPVDVAFVFDLSGSMAARERIMREAAIAFVLSHVDCDYRFAIVEVPPFGGVSPRTLIDFSDVATTTTAIARLSTHNRGGVEWSYDAFVGAVDGTLGLSWRLLTGSDRVLVWFGDEVGQTGRAITEADAARALRDAGVRFVGFVPVEVREYYDDLARATGGDLYDLDASATTIEIHLDESAERLCAP